MSRAARSAAAEPGPKAERFPEAGAPASEADARIWHAPLTGAPASGTSVDGPESGTPIEGLRLTEEDNDALQRLSVAVLAHAVTELQAPPLRGKPGEARELSRRQARDWLLGGSPGLRFWADVAGVDPDALGSRLRARLGADGDDDAE